MTCTLVIVNDGQKDPKLLNYCFKALSANDLSGVQVMLLQQAADGSYARKLADRQPFDIEIFESTGEVVDGIRLWDVMADLKAMRPKMTGEYLLYIHKEFIAEPDYFARSLAWLSEHGPELAMTNLMRLGTPEDIDRRTTSSCKFESAKIKRALTAGRPFPAVNCLPWVFHREPKPGEWVEDAFFVKLGWLDEISFLEHADRQLFQDVFDIVGEIVKVTGTPAARVPEGRLYHLWHKKQYCHFTDAVIGHFVSNRKRWAGTCMADAVLMRQIQYYLKSPTGHRKNPIALFRRNAFGTVTRYMEAFNASWAAQVPEAPPETKPRPEVTWIKNALVLCKNMSWRDRKHPIRAAAAGMEAMAIRAHVVSPGRWPIASFSPDLTIVWNGQKGRMAELTGRFRANGSKTLILERGFFDRMNYSQMDMEGFNHRASWAKNIGGPAPVSGVRRFKDIEQAVGRRERVSARKKGYILVLGQTGGDAQLCDSELCHPAGLLDAVMNATDQKIVFRPHPDNGWRPEYIESMEGPLSTAIEGARFCITINSNAGNDALWAGVPVLCFGPALCEMAGVAMGTSAARLPHDIKFMLDGWAPDEKRVLSYLHWLCARQWNADEIASGNPLRQILAEGNNT